MEPATEHAAHIERLAAAGLVPASAQLVLLEWSAEPDGGTPPRWLAPLHRHHHDDEGWYVLDGTLGFRIGDREVEVGPGGAVIAPAGVAHTYWNARPTPARYVLVATRALNGIFEELESGARLDDDALAALFARHDSEFLGRQ